jgi:hypothetical protein
MQQSIGTLAEMYSLSPNNVVSSLRMAGHIVVIRPIIHEGRLRIQVAYLQGEDRTPLGVAVGTDLYDAISQASEEVGNWILPLSDEPVWIPQGPIVEAIHMGTLTDPLYRGTYIDASIFLASLELAAGAAQEGLNPGWWWKAKWMPSDRPDLTFHLTRRNSPAEWTVAAWYQGCYAECHYLGLAYAIELCLERIYDQLPLRQRIKRLWRNQPV